MNAFSQIPFRRKLRLVILATCMAALTVASVALFALQFHFYKRDYRRDLAAVAQILAEMSTGAITAGLPESTGDILAALKAKPHVTGAFVRVPDSKTAYGEFGSVPPMLTHTDLPDEFSQFDGELVYVRAITDGPDRVGSLYLVSDYRADSLRLHGLYAGILISVLGTSVLVAALVSVKLERFISEPIHNLAETARGIASRGDYSLRARKSAEDEIGEFADSFNHMLNQIESRDLSLRHEIAERVRAEQELQRVDQQLMDASRHAGMAEVATGVLHNVGNVLNSVNVSATLISEKLGIARTEKLEKAARLLLEHNGSLAEFLTHDPKGKLLPGYLVDAAHHLSNERLGAQEELTLLARNIEHIKEIVSMQQSYASVSGVIEILDLATLIDDAVQMNSGAFDRHGVTLRRDYEPVPPVPVDQHKVLQILINIMRNAKYALDEADPSEKRLTISLRKTDEPAIEIAIADNGVGITEDNLTKVFMHGFTTRKNGHGFGLHSGALAAQQMGGRLTAQSLGLGHGATFTLTLPLPADA